MVDSLSTGQKFWGRAVLLCLLSITLPAACVEHHFKAHDINNDDHHNHTEFRTAAVESVGIDLTPLEGRLAHEKHDVNKDGRMDLHEFTAAVEHEQLMATLFRRKLDRILFPIGLLSAAIVWSVALYFLAQLVIYEDTSDFNTNCTAFCCGSAILLQIAFTRGWTLVIEVAGPAALLVVGIAVIIHTQRKKQTRTKYE